MPAPAEPDGRRPRTRLLLVRHAQSEWNADGRWQGWADPPLSGLGRRQSTTAADALGRPDAIVASDLERARETAAIIAAALGSRAFEVEPALRERDLGDFTGLTRAEIEARWPGMVGSFVRSAPPGGETAEQVLQRALPALLALAGRYPGQQVLVVSHGGVIRNVEHHLGGEAHPIPNLGGVWVDVENGVMTLGERVLLLDPDEVTVTVPQQL
jgi:broad specificity phosphatase PhoE